MISLYPPTPVFVRRDDFDLPTLGLRVAGVHTEDFGGKKRGLVATRAGAYFKNHTLVVIGILGQQQDLDLCAEGGKTRFRLVKLLARKRSHFRIRIIQYRAR